MRIYYLIDSYLAGNIDEPTFCDEFYYCYNLGLDYDTLKKEEYRAFSDLKNIESRFSEFEEDHKKYPGSYSTKKELKDKITETKEKLKLFWPKLKDD